MVWDQFTSIVEETLSYIEREKTEPPLACPYDGEPLSATPDGSGLFCKWGNYEYPRDPRII